MSTTKKYYVCETPGCQDAENECMMNYENMQKHLREVHHVDTGKPARRNFVSHFLFDRESNTHYEWVFDDDVKISQFTASTRSF